MRDARPNACCLMQANAVFWGTTTGKADIGRWWWDELRRGVFGSDSRFFGCGYAAPGSSAVSFMLAMLAQHSSPIVRSKPLLFGSMQSAIG